MRSHARTPFLLIVTIVLAESGLSAEDRKPSIEFTPPTISYSKRAQPVDFAGRIVPAGKGTAKYTVAVTLRAGVRERTLEAVTGKDGIFTFSTTPVPAQQGTDRVPLNLIFLAGRIQCTVKDQPFQVGKKTFRFREVRSISQGKRPAVLTREGVEVSGAITGLGSVQADFGACIMAVDLSKAPRIVVEEVEEVIDRVEYTITVRQGGKVVHQRDGTILLKDSPASATGNAKLPILASEPVVVRLPAGIEQLAVGGGGKYLILHLARLRKLAVFDVAESRVIRYLPAPAGDFLFVAGADKLVLILPAKKLLERWSLVTFEKERSATIDFAPDRAAMGSASAGPLVLWAQPRTAALIDLDSVEKLPATIEFNGNTGTHGLTIEAAPDGSAFTNWNRKQPGESTSEFGLSRLQSGKVIARKGHSAMAPCLASSDGGPVFTCDGNVYSGDMKPILAPELRGAALLPVRNSYVLVARWVGKERKAQLAFHVMNTLKEVFSVGELPELDGLVTDRTDTTLFSYDKRIQFVPSANTLLTIPATNDRIVLRKLDVDAALKQSPIDYLFVASVPMRRAMKGKEYAYPIAVKSKRGKVEYQLDSGPKGMSVSTSGRLTWNVPADFSEEEVPVIVAIRDAAGQEVFHSFLIDCR